MDNQTFQLLLTHLEEIKDQNKAQLELMNAHIKDDGKVHKVVERHSVYFSIMSLGIPGIVAYFSKKLGF